MRSPAASTPPSTAPPAAVLSALLDRGDLLVCATDRHGALTWVSPSFEAATGLGPAQWRGRALFGLDAPNDQAPDTAWRDAVAGGAGTPFDLALPGADGGRLAVCGRLSAHDDGHVCVLQPAAALDRLSPQARRLARVLDVVRQFGRIGVWERDAKTGEGRWDPNVFRFFDLPPVEATPDFDTASLRVHPDDRQRVGRREVLQQVGDHAQRFRVLGEGGDVRLLHTFWRVLPDADGQPAHSVGIMVDDTETHELSRSLGDANTQLEMALELGGIAVWRHDLRTNQMHYDARAWRMLGLTPRPEGLPIEEVRALIHPDDLPAVVASAQRCLAGAPHTDVEARYRHTDGHWVYVMNRRALMRDAGGQPVAFIGVALDVSRRVEETRQRLDLSRRLEATARAAGIGIWSLNLDGGASEWNSQMFELFDLPLATQPPRFPELLATRIHPDDRDRVRREGSRWLHEGDSAFEIEYRTTRPDGTVRWLLNRSDLDRGSPQRRVFGVTLDVTERKRTELALQQANARVVLAARGAGIGTWEYDLESGEAFWDAQMFLLRGLAPRERALSAEERYAMAHPDDRQRVREALATSLRSTEPVTYSFRVLRPDGQWRWLASRCVAMRDASGKVVRQLGVNWDVTEARQAENERQERLAAQRESRAKSQFLARMSHELRTPLNAVIGFAQLMLTGSPGDPAADRARLRHIHNAGEHLLSLINDVLDLSSLETGEMRMDIGAVQVGPLVQQALPLVERLAALREVRVHCGALDAVVRADPTRLRQVLLNLLSNAIKYNRQGGEVWVEAERHETQVRLRVRDNGRGLTPDQLRHLFEPFNRLGIDAERIEGTGIGLAIVKAIVTRMDARIDVDSAPGRGTTFTVTLADASHAAPQAVAAPAALAPARQFRGRLLYIEDNPVNVLLVQELVARCPGLEFVSEADGAHGVERAIATRPDLVLIDMQLPDFDGHEVLRRLRAEPSTARIPCIALSANAMQRDIERALAAGFADYWTKPIDFRAFMTALDALFGRSEAADTQR